MNPHLRGITKFAAVCAVFAVQTGAVFERGWEGWRGHFVADIIKPRNTVMIEPATSPITAPVRISKPRRLCGGSQE